MNYIVINISATSIKSSFFACPQIDFNSLNAIFEKCKKSIVASIIDKN